MNNKKNILLGADIIGKEYMKMASDALKTVEKHITTLLANRVLP